jgi:hypothetical protein
VGSKRRTNAHTQDKVLFLARNRFPITELAYRGGNLVLYTEETAVYQQFKDWQLIKELKYYQANSLVGVDLVFPPGAKYRLEKAVERYFQSNTSPERTRATKGGIL